MKKQEIIRETVSQNINDFSEICEKIEKVALYFVKSGRCSVKFMQIVSVYYTGDIDQKLQIFSVSIHFKPLSDK